MFRDVHYSTKSLMWATGVSFDCLRRLHLSHPHNGFIKECRAPLPHGTWPSAQPNANCNTNNPLICLTVFGPRGNPLHIFCPVSSKGKATSSKCSENRWLMPLPALEMTTALENRDVDCGSIYLRAKTN